MDFNKINTDQRACEANKKVNYRQRGSIETKKAIDGKNIGTVTCMFSFVDGEVIESALFEKTVRDCKGNEIRKSQLRRFRKVGSDEWFSVPAFYGNELWDKYFTIATEEEAIKQGIGNQKISSTGIVDDVVGEKKPIIDLYKKTSVNEAEKKPSNAVPIIGIIVLAGLGFIAYRMITKKD